MGILTINERTEFIDRLMDHINVKMTGGRYFLNENEKRNKLIEEINNIPMQKVKLTDMVFIIRDLIIKVLGYKPEAHCHYASDYNGKKMWCFDYTMPPESTLSKNKNIHIGLVFK